MKIAYLLFDPGIPIGGTKGASIHVREFCAAATTLGHEVHLIASTVIGNAPDGVVVHDLKISVESKRDESKILAAETFRRKAIEVLNDIDPDLIYERLSLFFGYGPKIATKLNIPRMLEINAPIADERKSHFGLTLVEEARRCEKHAIDGSDVVVVSEALSKYAANNGASRIRVIQNGVDASRFDSTTTATGIPTIGFVGSLKPWHGVANLIDASKILSDARVGHRLLIVGDGPERERLDQQVSNLGCEGRVEFSGAVDPPEVPHLLARMDLGVAPYLQSHDFYFSPLKILEYMACGLPIVATDTPSIREITAGLATLIADPSPLNIAEAIANTLSNLDHARNLAGLAQSRAEQYFDWKIVVAQILDGVTSTGDLRLKDSISVGADNEES